MKQVAVVFPGQGSQSVAMLKDIAARFSSVEETFAEASSVLGYDLWQLTQNGPSEKLDQTIHTQPALLAAGVAIYRILLTRDKNVPAFLAGHSLGEYTALVCAQALAFTDAIKLVAARGQYMQEAVPNGIGGSMAAIIGLDDSTVKEICATSSTVTDKVSAANFNSVGQVVIAGHVSAVERAMASAKQQGAKMAIMLPVSVPSHCALMQPAANRLALLLETIPLQVPTIPVINNVDVLKYQTTAGIIDGLTRQLYQPVRWVETIQYFIKEGVNTIIECGPGKILTGLNKRIDKNLELITTADLASLERMSQ